MSITITDSTKRQLRQLYQEEGDGQVMLKDFAARVKSREMTTVGRTATRCHLAPAAVGSLFKLFDTMGLGHYIASRRGGQARFVWSLSVIEVGRYAAGLTDELGEPQSSANEPPTSEPGSRVLLGSIPFQLRPGLTLSWFFPLDLTPAEAERVAAWVKTLPL